MRKGGRHKKLAGDALTPKELARKKFLAEKAAKRRQRMKKCLLPLRMKKTNIDSQFRVLIG